MALSAETKSKIRQTELRNVALWLRKEAKLNDEHGEHYAASLMIEVAEGLEHEAFEGKARGSEEET